MNPSLVVFLRALLVGAVLTFPFAASPANASEVIRFKLNEAVRESLPIVCTIRDSAVGLAKAMTAGDTAVLSRQAESTARAGECLTLSGTFVYRRQIYKGKRASDGTLFVVYAVDYLLQSGAHIALYVVLPNYLHEEAGGS